jgi:hypothetical protein
MRGRRPKTAQPLHPLIEPRAPAAWGLFGGWGVGIGIMIAHALIPVGALISISCASLILWLYFSHIRRIRITWRQYANVGIPSRSELTIAICMIVVMFPTSVYVCYQALKPEMPSSKSNFPYLRTLLNEDRTSKERALFVENAKSIPIQNVEVVFQDLADPRIRHVFKAPILYQDGGWFTPIGEPHTLRIGAGQHVATINSLDGSFTEYLSLRVDDGVLKQKIEVFKSLPRGRGGIEDLLLHEEE